MSGEAGDNERRAASPSETAMIKGGDAGVNRVVGVLSNDWESKVITVLMG